MRQYIRLYILLTLTFLLSACGFHLRNASELPTQLQTLYYQPENPYDPVASELKDTLTSLHIKLVATPQQAPFTLALSKSVSTHTRADLNNISQASSIVYSQRVNVSLINNKTHKKVISSNFAASMSQYLNQNQIMTTNTSSLATQSLPHDLVTHIFVWLTTNNVRNALNGKRPATPHKK